MSFGRTFPTTTLACWIVLAASVTDAVAQRADTTGTRTFEVQGESGLLRTINGREVVELQRPRLRDGSTTIRAERMIQPRDSVYLFTGNVRIVDEADTLTADRVEYDSVTKIGSASGRVRFGDGEVVVNAPLGSYDSDRKRADFSAGVELVDSTSTLTSRSGTYWTETEVAEFSGAVRLVQDSLRMAADSLTYDRQSRVSEAWAGVVIERRDSGADSLAVTWVIGDHATNDEVAGRSRVLGDVLVLQISADSSGAVPDSLWIRASRVAFARSDSLDQVTAVDSVSISRGDFASLADSVVYRVRPATGSGRRERRESRLFGSPIAWVGTSQVTGDSLRAVGRGSSLDSLFVDGRAFVTRRDSSDGPSNQLKGRRMVGLFERDSLSTLTVYSNAEAFYTLGSTPEREGGSVRMSGDRIVFRPEKGDVTDIRAYEGVEATWYPAGLVTEATRLDGAAWQPGRRPDARPFRTRYLTIVCRVVPERCPAEVDPR